MFYLKSLNTKISVLMTLEFCICFSPNVINKVGFRQGAKKHKLTGLGFVKVNEAAKHFSRSQVETAQTGAENFSSVPSTCTWGQEGGKNRGKCGWGLSWQQLSCPGNSSVPMVTPKFPGRRTWE